MTVTPSSTAVVEGSTLTYTVAVNHVVTGTPFVVTLSNGQTVTIPVGQSSATGAAIAVRPDDAYAQGNVNTVVSITNTSGANFEAVDRTSTATTTVTDDTDATTLTLTPSAASVTEGGSITYTATLGNAVQGSPVVLTLSNGQTITIPVGQTTGTGPAFNVRADDFYVQGTDTLNVTVTGRSGGNFESLNTTGTATTTVTDDADQTVVTVTPSSASVVEGSTLTYTVAVNQAVTGTPFVVTLSNGQAVTIPVGASSATSPAIAVRADDAYAQGSVNTVVSITNTSGGNFEAVNTASTATTAVTDDSDATTLTLSASAASVTEGGSIVYTATLSNAVTGSPVVLTLSNGQTITIAVGQTTGTSPAFNVRADDFYVQGTDTLNVTVTGRTGGNFEAVTNTSTATTTVTDDADQTVVTVTASATTIAEGNTLTYTVAVNQAVTGTPFVVTLSNGQTVTIPVGASSATSPAIAVRADDAYAQGSVNTVVSITNTSGGNFEAVNTASTATTAVTDDSDATTLTLSASTASVTEGGSIVYTATVSNAVQGSPLVLTLSNGQT
ncbi:immunoglobulin-like domain-containing protein, partial [Rhizobacter sp. Root1221]|uniref:immunoglobulin-like domain-containing protein n=1 Tax=Rhizobacter sp. Root1221 TaxID=1736433 RepID=UPI00351905DF